MSSPSNMYDVGEHATLHKAKQMFLQHLAEVDTSGGPTETLVLKFMIEPEVVDALNDFVTEHGCTMESRLLTREEQDKIDKRRKTCAQYTWFTVTPEAQKEYLKNPQTPLKNTPLKRSSPTKTPITRTPSKSTTSARKPPKTEKVKKTKPSPQLDVAASVSRESSDGDDIAIPREQLRGLCTRFADALLLLPTDAPGIECRDALYEVAREMREFLPAKRPLSEDTEETEGRKAKKRRASRA